MFKIFWVSPEEEHEEKIELELEEAHEEEAEEEVWQVVLDVLESQDDIFIIVPIAWVLYEEIDLSINKTVLTIKWTRKKPEEYLIEWISIKNSECFWWKFVRNIILPENLAFNKIKAYMQNNLLVIWIPKLKYDSKSIKINKIES